MELEQFFARNKFKTKEEEKKKKGLYPFWGRVLPSNSLQVQSQSSHILIANDNEKAILAFRAKISLKSN